MYMTIYKSHEHTARGARHIFNRHASRFACVNLRTERTPPRRGANIEPFEFQRLRDHASIDKLVRYARIPLIAPLFFISFLVFRFSRLLYFFPPLSGLLM
jgi:hypothetical protein